MSKKRTHEEYVEELKIKNPNVEVVGKYVNNRTAIAHRCIKHDIIWNASPSNVLNGNGCKECCKEKIGNKNRMTHNQYVERLKQLNIDVDVVGLYAGMNVAITHYWKQCGHYTDARPSNVLNGSRCYICGKQLAAEKRKISHDEYISKVKEINPNIEVCEEYVSAKQKIKHKCLKHNIIWYAYPYVILRGSGCEKCCSEKIGDALRKSRDAYIHELKDKNVDLSLIGEYINSNLPTKHKCKKCGYEWSPFPSNILSGSGCPKCNESHGEKNISDYLINHNIDFISQYTFSDCIDKRTLPFDLYLPLYNICIEYDGEQHFKSVDFFGGEEGFKNRKLHDKIKTDYCKNNNIQLIRIRYDENVEDKLNSFIH